MTTDQAEGNIETSNKNPISCPSSEIMTKWSKDAETCLLTSYREIEDTFKPIKNKWKVVADDIAAKGFSGYTAEQCRLKIKSLKEKFERHKKMTNKSGAATPVESLADDLVSTFHGLPDVNPTSTLDSETSSNCSEGNIIQIIIGEMHFIICCPLFSM